MQRLIGGKKSGMGVAVSGLSLAIVSASLPFASANASYYVQHRKEGACCQTYCCRR